MSAATDRLLVRRDRMVLLVLLVLAGAISGMAGVVHAVHRSQDFQWSGERLLLQHIDPWQDYLAGDPVHGLLATQVPNYLPVLYVFLVPFGLLPAHAANLAWAVCNLAFAATSAVLAARFYGLRSSGARIAVASALLAATPTRTSINNGQQGLFVLFLWSLALLHAEPVRTRNALIAGVSYLKYSFAPALALYLLLRDCLRRGTRALLISLAPAVAATAAVWLWITGGRDFPHLRALFTEPLAVTRVGYQPTGDPGQTFMDLFEFLLGGGPVATPRLTLISLLVALALTACILLRALAKLRSSNEPTTSAESVRWLVALTATMSFVFYKHHPYDEAVFLFAFCYALRHWQRAAGQAGLFLIVYCWYVQPWVDLRIVFSLQWCCARILILLALVLCVYRIWQPSQRVAEPVLA